MVVGFKTEKKKEDEEKKLPEDVPVQTFSTRKKATIGCGAIVGLAVVIAIIMVILATMVTVTVHGVVSKKAEVHDVIRDEDYDHPGFRGCRDWEGCGYDDDDVDDDENPWNDWEDDDAWEDWEEREDFFQEWLDNLLDDEPVYETWYQVDHGVYTVDVEAFDRSETIFMADTNTGYTAIKTRGAGSDAAFQCYLLDHDVIPASHLQVMQDYIDAADDNVNSLRVGTVTSNFFGVGEPVPDNRDYIGQSIVELCEGLDFHYIYNGQEMLYAQAQDILEAHGFSFDSQYEWFMAINDAFWDARRGAEGAVSELNDLLDEFDERIVIMPPGYYDDLTYTPTGRSWSLNIQRYASPLFTEYVATFEAYKRAKK